jgi:hypothetical protein
MQDAPSVLKPSTPTGITFVLHITVWRVIEQWISLSPLGAYTLRRLILTR